MTEEQRRITDHTCDIELNNEINLLNYWRVIWKRRWMIGGIVLVAVIAAGVTSLFMTDIYRAKAVIMPVTNKEGGASSAAALAGLAQQFANIPGIALPGSASASEILSLLQSNILREKVIRRHNLMPVLFYKRWDPQRQAWKRVGEAGFDMSLLDHAERIKRTLTPTPPGRPRQDPDIPSTWDALRLLDDILMVNQNIKQSTITISADFHNPDLAAKIVEYTLATLTDYMSSEAKRVAKTNRRYLEEQLSGTTDPIIKQKAYNMIAQQIETGMMAEVKENFAFKIIDPPLAPDKKIKPKHAQMVMLSLIAALFIGILTAFAAEYFERVKPKK